MRHRPPHVFAACAMLLAASACSKPAEAPAKAAGGASAPLAAAPSASQPFNLKRSNASVEIDVSVPAIPGGAKAAERLRASLQTIATDFEKDAETQIAEMKKEGFESQPYSLDIGTTIIHATPDVVSLLFALSDYQGGAHPNTVFKTETFDTATGSAITLADLFGADWEASPNGREIAAALCADVKKRRDARLKEAGVDPMETECPSLKDVPWNLAPSTETGKAAGLIFQFDPYAIGSYAEGPYQGLVPLSVFEAALKPSRKGLFAGTPKPVLD
jgi:hypothetical protein